MITVPAPASTPTPSVRGDALRVIAGHLPAGFSALRPLREAGDEIVADILIDLEVRFAISLDPDACWPAATAGELATVVSIATRARRAPPAAPTPDNVVPLFPAASALARDPLTQGPWMVTNPPWADRAVTPVYLPPEAILPPHPQDTQAARAVLAALMAWAVVAGAVGGVMAYALGLGRA